MSAKYTPLPTSDPEMGPEGSQMNFESIHLYDSIQDFSGDRVGSKYSSIFSYGGGPMTVTRTGGTQGMIPSHVYSLSLCWQLHFLASSSSLSRIMFVDENM